MSLKWEKLATAAEGTLGEAGQGSAEEGLRMVCSMTSSCPPGHNKDCAIRIRSFSLLVFLQHSSSRGCKCVPCHGSPASWRFQVFLAPHRCLRVWVSPTKISRSISLCTSTGDIRLFDACGQELSCHCCSTVIFVLQPHHSVLSAV